MKFWRRNVNTVFVMLGNSCNMNCIYCLQHPLVHEPLQKNVNPEIYDFLSALAKENESGKIRLQFYGGEPLLYFQSMKEIITETEKRKIPCSYSAITNGRALTDEMVDFFVSHDVAITVSWDGFGTRETRRFNVMSVPELRNRFMRLPHLGLSGVISAKAYPVEILEAFQTIADEYEESSGGKISVNLDEIFDTGLTDKRLLDVDFTRVSHDMRRLAMLYLAVCEGVEKRKGYYTKLSYIGGILTRLYRFYVEKDGKWDSQTVYCGNGLSVLNLDLAGNLYPCHNVGSPIGDIHTPFFTYLERLLAGDNTRKYERYCENCVALPCCRGGCKLVDAKARRESYCRLKRAVYGPVLETFEKYGGKIGGNP